MPPAFDPTPVWRLPAADSATGRRAVAWTAGPDGELAVLLAGPGSDGELVVVAPDGERRQPVHGLTDSPDHLGLLPGGLLLVVDPFAEQTEQRGWTDNAVVHGPDGQPVRSFCLGEDVQALSTDATGRIWTAYGDEGIYGDHPQSLFGLAGWDDHGSPVWAPERKQLKTWPLEGLAAATEGARTWLAWYSDPTAVRLTGIEPDGTAETRTCPVADLRGFAIAGARAALLTGRGDRPTLHRALLDGKQWKVVERRTLRVDGDVDERAHGRDGALLLRAGNGWYRIGV